MTEGFVYEPHVVRVNLATGVIQHERKDAAWARKYVGGMGFGTRILWEELPAETPWNSPDNKLVFSLGALTGTTTCGSGLCCVNTIGALTNGLSSAQTLGHFGSCLRRADVDILIIEDKSPSWVYLYIDGQTIELRDASFLTGLDTWETEDALKERLGLPGRTSSVACIGVAGENLVRFAGIMNDKGHIAASNGPGCVMGDKHLKAIAVKREDRVLEVADVQALDEARQLWFEDANANTASGKFKSSGVRYVGTLGSLNMMNMAHLLPVKNYTETTFPTCGNFNRDELEKDERFKWVRTACWACPWNHCHSLEIVDGKYKGIVADEPEYEGMSATSALIGNFDDTAGGLALDSAIDHCGVDLKEAGFLLAMVYELYDCGILTKDDLDGLDMTWGNCDAGIALMDKIARREGIGNILAEGTKRAAEAIGHGATDHAVYLKQGFSPHIHDQRAQWSRLPGFGMSDYGSNLMNPVEGFVDKDNFGIDKPAKAFDADEIIDHYVKVACHRPIDDAVGVCMFYTQADWRYVAMTLNAVAGWDMDVPEMKTFGYRMVSLMRALNMRNGLRAYDYGVSKRFLAPPKEGEWSPKIADETTVQYMFDGIAKGLGWDVAHACPTPETLRELGLDDVAETFEDFDFDHVDEDVRKA